MIPASMAHGGMKAWQLPELAQPFPKQPEARPGVSCWEWGCDPPKRTWRREGGWEEPLRFGCLALVALRSPGKVLVSTAPGYKFQLGQCGTAFQLG